MVDWYLMSVLRIRGEISVSAESMGIYTKTKSLIQYRSSSIEVVVNETARGKLKVYRRLAIFCVKQSCQSGTCIVPSSFLCSIG